MPIYVGRVASKWHQLEDYTFEKYCKEHGKSYAKPVERKMRQAIFEERLAAIKAHNAGKF
jgi:hypothetical protein